MQIKPLAFKQVTQGLGQAVAMGLMYNMTISSSGRCVASCEGVTLKTGDAEECMAECNLHFKVKMNEWIL